MKCIYPLLLTSLVYFAQGSGYYPPIGGPWSRYTTTQPPPPVPGFNLPATTSAPPPEVTFAPRPEPNNPSLNGNRLGSGNNQGNNNNNKFFGTFGENSYGQGQNPNAGNFFIIRDPETGEEFYMSKQNFWNIFHNRPVQSSSSHHTGYQHPLDQEEDEYFNRERYSGNSRGQRVNQYQNSNSNWNRRARDIPQGEVRHIDQLNDESDDGPIPESYEFLTQGRSDSVNSEELSQEDEAQLMKVCDTLNLEIVCAATPDNVCCSKFYGDMSTQEDADKERATAQGLFTMFFPQMHQNTQDKMLYTFTSYRLSGSQPEVEATSTTTTERPTTKVTSTPRTTTTSTSTTEAPTTTEEVEEDVPTTTSIPDYEGVQPTPA